MRLRMERGLSRATLARLAQVTEADLCAYEAGERRMPAALFYDLATTMDVTISAFFACPDLPGAAVPDQLQPRPH
jgi:transcriptional regulator with XRE-family HTH domain